MTAATATHQKVTHIGAANGFAPPAVPDADRRELTLKVLGESIYPGAKRESVIMALEYCQALGLDPMQKPVHIVQMRVKTGTQDERGYDEYTKRDVILPGIGLYRTMAARTGTYAGITEPEFGENMPFTFKVRVWEEAPNGKRSSRLKDEEIFFPEWCRITVRRLVAGHVAEFTATEYWWENYATAGRDTDAPNEMWRRRVRGQLAKCTEAQALRKAFPEVLGSLPTAEEMEGRTLDMDGLEELERSGAKVGEAHHVHDAEDEQPRERARPMPRRKAKGAEQATQAATDVQFTEANPPAAASPAKPQRSAKPAPAPATDSPRASAGMLGLLRVKGQQKGLAEADLAAHVGIASLDQLTIAQGNELLAWIANLSKE